MQYNYFQYQVMFFSVFIIFANFQDYINKVLVEKINIFIIIYINNIMIFIKNTSQSYIKAI